MSYFWMRPDGRPTASFSVGSKASETTSCNCIGPRNGEPYCPCRMRGVIERDGRWIEPERDLGPVRRYDSPALVGTLADAHSKKGQTP